MAFLFTIYILKNVGLIIGGKAKAPRSDVRYLTEPLHACNCFIVLLCLVSRNIVTGVKPLHWCNKKK